MPTKAGNVVYADRTQRKEMKQLFFLTLMSIVITSCVVSNEKYFRTVSEADRKSYGYDFRDPIKIKNGSLTSSINSSNYFLSKLKTDKGEPLKIVGRSSVINPNYKGSPIGLYNRNTGMPIGGGGMILDEYHLLPRDNSVDTIKIYLNPYEKGEVKIPMGLKFIKD